jgi:hypothetical protein
MNPVVKLVEAASGVQVDGVAFQKFVCEKLGIAGCYVLQVLAENVDKNFAVETSFNAWSEDESNASRCQPDELEE